MSPGTGVAVIGGTGFVVGFDIANEFTSLRDIGRAVARLAVLSTAPHTGAAATAAADGSMSAAAKSVPDDVRITGATMTFEDVRDIVARVRVVAPARIRMGDLKEKRAMLGVPGVPSHEYIRVAMAEGKLDLAEANDNELVNPGGTLWTWRSVEDYIRGQFPSRRSE